MLPGLYNPSAGAAAAAGFSVEYVSNTTQTAFNGTLTMPTLEVGDIILVLARVGSLSAEAPARYGTGFTAIQTKTGLWNQSRESYNLRLCSSYRIAQSGDSGASIGGFVNSNNETASIAVYRPSSAITTITLLDLSQQGTAGNPASSTITTSSSSLTTIGWAASNGGSSTNMQVTPAMTFSPTGDFEVGASGLRCQVLVQAPTASNITADAADAGNQTIYIDGYMEVS